MSPPPPPPPGLIDDLIGEILLRLPPEDPACLVRASIVSKPWRRLLSDPGFPCRYRDFHGSPPLLGIVRSDSHDGCEQFFHRFIPTKEVSPVLNPLLEPCYIEDCCHGRILLATCEGYLIIWDPITNSRHQIEWPDTRSRGSRYRYSYTAVVLCAMDGCDHLGCPGDGPSLVVFVYSYVPTNDHQLGALASAKVYSTETGEWNADVSSVNLGPIASNLIWSSLLAGGALFFTLDHGRKILKYELAGSGLSAMSPPTMPVWKMVLMKAEGGGLGACGVDGHSLHLWAWRIGSGGISGWEHSRVIQLDIGDLSEQLDVVDFAEGAGSIFVKANDGIFAVGIKSGQARKIAEGGDFIDIFPFMCFYTPEITLPPDCKRQ